MVKAGTIIQLQATGNAANFTLNWSPAQGLSDAHIYRPTLKVEKDEIYTLTATGENNCTATSQVKVTVQKDILIPNAFSPNGDGIHDTWRITNIEQYPGALLEVYDRYGALVFSNKGVMPWNGNSRNKPLPAGVYYYLLKLAPDSAPVKGPVTLLR